LIARDSECKKYLDCIDLKGLTRLITRDLHVGQEGKRKNFSLQASSFSRLGMQIWTSQNSAFLVD
jgi:hypothetical protein